MANQSPPDIDALFTPQTRDQYRTLLVTALVSVGIPADQWIAGGVFSTILTYTALFLSMMAAIIAVLIKGLFLPTATGGNLKVLAKYWYGVDVPTATFASGPVTFVNASGNNYPNMAAGTLIALNSKRNVQFTNPDIVSIGPNSSVTVLNMTASVQGSAGNAAPGGVDTMVSSLLGVTCSNPVAIIGSDGPSDIAIQALCTNSLGVRSVRGPRTAYGYAVQTAVNAVTGKPVNINRWSAPESSHTGIVNVTVAGPAGTTDPDDLQGVRNNIEKLTRPNAVTVNVFAATPTIYAPSIQVWARGPAGSGSDLVPGIQDGIEAYLEDYDIGGVAASDDAFPAGSQGLFATGIDGVIAEALKAEGYKLISTKGVTDLFLGPQQVAVNGITQIQVMIVPVTGGVV